MRPPHPVPKLRPLPQVDTFLAVNKSPSLNPNPRPSNLHLAAVVVVAAAVAVIAVAAHPLHLVPAAPRPVVLQLLLPTQG